MLHYVYVVLLHYGVMLCCYIMLHFVVLCCVALHYVKLCFMLLCYVMLCCYVMLLCFMLCYVMLCYVMLCYVCYVVLQTSLNSKLGIKIAFIVYKKMWEYQ